MAISHSHLWAVLVNTQGWGGKTSHILYIRLSIRLPGEAIWLVGTFLIGLRVLHVQPKAVTQR
jgi:hypothetical protein